MILTSEQTAHLRRQGRPPSSPSEGSAGKEVRWRRTHPEASVRDASLDVSCPRSQAP